MTSLRNALAWWLGELAGLVPVRLRAWLADRGPRLVLSIDADGCRVIEERGGGARVLWTGSGDTTTSDRRAAAGALAEAAAARPRLPAGIRFPLSACYSRTLDLPTAAQRDIGRIMTLDLERATPFRAGDVYAVSLSEGTAGPGRIAARQVVIKRSLVDAAVADLAAAGVPARFADCWNAARSQALAVDFLAASDPRTASARPASAALPAVLASAALLLAGLAAWQIVSLHEQALAKLQGETAAARGKAQAVRQTMDRSEAVLAEINALKSARAERPLAASILDDLTRLLPDSVWLADLRIDGDTIEMAGLARSAAPLLAILEKSGVVEGAELTAPVTFDPREDRERFAIRMRLRKPPEARKG